MLKREPPKIVPRENKVNMLFFGIVYVFLALQFWLSDPIVPIEHLNILHLNAFTLLFGREISKKRLLRDRDREKERERENNF